MQSEDNYECTYECFGMPRIGRKPMGVAERLAQCHPKQSAGRHQHLRDGSEAKRTGTYAIEMVYPAQICEYPDIVDLQGCFTY